MNTIKSTKLEIYLKLALLTSLTIVFQLLANSMTLGNVSFTLSLVPVVIGAFTLGPIAGLYLGTVLGAINFILTFGNPFLLSLFNASPIMYILVCFGKTMLAGWVCGLIYKALQNKSKWVAIIVSSASAPIVNTGVFLAMMFTFFKNALATTAGIQNDSSTVFLFILTAMITYNFFIELGLNMVLCPAFSRIIYAIRKK